MLPDLRAYLDLLRREGELAEINAPVDPYLEAAEIHRRVVEQKGKALFFKNIKNAAFPLVTNLLGNEKRVELAFGSRPEQFVRDLVTLIERSQPPSIRKMWEGRNTIWQALKIGTKKVPAGKAYDITAAPPGLMRLPLLTTWKEDGGPFVTLPIVYTENPLTHAPNCGIYRLQRFDDSTTGFHCQIGKGGGFHLAEARRLGRKLPVNVAIGGPPALTLAAAAPLPENVPELLLASLLLGGRWPMAENPVGPLPLIANAEFVLVGEVDPGESRPEGPFGDHYGYYSLKHDYPVFRCRALLHKRDAICAATVVGKGRQEDCYIGDYIQTLLAPVFPLVMPQVIDLWAYGETGYHSLAAAVVKQQRYKREALAAAFRILGEGQLSLTKFLLVLEERCDLKDFKRVLQHVLERADLSCDLYVLGNTSMDTLDYTSTRINEGSKAILLGVGEKKRELPGIFNGEAPAGTRQVKTFCRGCLVIDGPAYQEARDFGKVLAGHAAFQDYPLIVLTDDAAKTARSNADFLWYTFTRFDAALDIEARNKAIVNNQVSFTAPIVIDARMKPSYPAELECDEDTRKLVDRRWGEYFPE